MIDNLHLKKKKKKLLLDKEAKHRSKLRNLNNFFSISQPKPNEEYKHLHKTMKKGFGEVVKLLKEKKRQSEQLSEYESIESLPSNIAAATIL